MNRSDFANRLRSTVIPEGTSPQDLIAMMLPISDALIHMMPESLFRYRRFNEWTLGAFKEDIVYAVPADKFNDPYDMLVRYDLVEIEKGINYLMSQEGIQQLKNWFQEGKDFPEAVKQALPDGLNDALKESLLSIDNVDPLIDRIEDTRRQILSLLETYFPLLSETTKKFSTIACFSETVKSILMWSHYTDSHKGFALEYNFRPTLENPIKNVGIFPVVYDEERPDASAYIGWAFLIIMGIRTMNPDTLSCIKAALHKSPVWEYEKEWRLIDSSPRELFSDSVSSFVFKPVAIYYGQHMPFNNRVVLHEIAQEKGISEFEMYLDYSSPVYEMKFRPFRNNG